MKQIVGIVIAIMTILVILVFAGSAVTQVDTSSAIGTVMEVPLDMILTTAGGSWTIMLIVIILLSGGMVIVAINSFSGGKGGRGRRRRK